MIKHIRLCDIRAGCRNTWHIHHAKTGGGQVLICIYGEIRNPVPKTNDQQKLCQHHNAKQNYKMLPYLTHSK